MERAHLESEIQQVPPPLLGHPSAGVLSSRGWGWVDSPALRESVSPPFPTTRSSPARPRLPCFPGPWQEGGRRGMLRGIYQGRQVENSAPAHPRKRVNTIAAFHPRVPPCLRSPFLAGGWISKFVTGSARPPRDLRRQEGGGGGGRVDRERVRYRCLSGSVDASHLDDRRVECDNCSFNPRLRARPCILYVVPLASPTMRGLIY